MEKNNELADRMLFRRIATDAVIDHQIMRLSELLDKMNEAWAK